MRLKQLRVKMGISQLKLALDLNMNQTVSAVMRTTYVKPTMLRS